MSGMPTRSPGQPLRRDAKVLVQEAKARITGMPVREAGGLLGDPRYLLVDIREPRERQGEGGIPGAFPAPRGMLEFWVDPNSPYYKPALDDGRILVLFCASGWRSALATAALLDMGRDDVVHLEGGFRAWQCAGLPVEQIT